MVASYYGFIREAADSMNIICRIFFSGAETTMFTHVVQGLSPVCDTFYQSSSYAIALPGGFPINLKHYFLLPKQHLLLAN